MRFVILGGGPAGLGCAYELGRSGVASVVIEKNPQIGGLCRTLQYKGYLFDIGGHRFLTKNREINQLWRLVLGKDLLRVKRRSRIYYRGHFLNYPLQLRNALQGLGWWEALLCLSSYLYARTLSPGDDTTFEGWMINRFGKRLYEIFFKTYTEKVWAVPCSQISSDWAIQRIQSLSLAKAICHALSHKGGKAPKTLSQEFFYPAKGPGLFFERLRDITEVYGARYQLNSEFKALYWKDACVTSVDVKRADGDLENYEVGAVFSSIPLTLLIQRMKPEPPPAVISAAQNLKFRSFLVVNLILDKADLFPDQWLYIHAPGVRVSRIQNYKNWSPAMVPDTSTTSLGMEYFVTEGDRLWNLSDESMMNLALEELAHIGLARRELFLDGFVIRVANAYPVYGPDYQTSLGIIRRFLSRFSNLQAMGRAGMFRYDNSDHALLTGLYAARNLLGSSYDLWEINTEREYHEEFQSTEIY